MTSLTISLFISMLSVCQVAGHSALMGQGGALGELVPSVQQTCSNVGECKVSPIGNYQYPPEGKKFLTDQYSVREEFADALVNWEVIGDNNDLGNVNMKDPESCGRFDPNAQVTLNDAPVPFRVVRDYNGHKGRSEIYVDGNLVFKTNDLQAPTRAPGFSGQFTIARDHFNCDKASCKVRWLWSANRRNYQQLYVQCFTVMGNGQPIKSMDGAPSATLTALPQSTLTATPQSTLPATLPAAVTATSAGVLTPLSIDAASAESDDNNAIDNAKQPGNNSNNNVVENNNAGNNSGGAINSNGGAINSNGGAINSNGGASNNNGGAVDNAKPNLRSKCSRQK